MNKFPVIHAAKSTPCLLASAAPDQDDLSLASYVFAVWNLIIRPPRSRYTAADLVAKYPLGLFKVKGHEVHRTDFTVFNARGLRLACTVFQPLTDSLQVEKACVVYCHGNGASRLAGFDLVNVFAPLNISVVCFDFAGSGWSDGDYVSLGFHEKDDLSAVIEHVRADWGFTRVGIWGHSMGAATCLMHAERDTSLAGVLADSPFADLGELIKEICCDQLHLPSFLISSILPIVRHAIQRKANFDINDISPAKHVANCFIPALFLHGDADNFIAPSNSAALQSNYSGESMRLIMPGVSHASRRPLGFLERAAVFFVRALRWEPYVPSGITERDLSELGRLHMEPTATMLSQVHKQVKDKIRRLLDSSSPAEQTLGLVQAACKLCGTYRGAAVLPTSTVNLVSSLNGSWCPVRYTGTLVLGNDDTEVALCWSRRAGKDESCTGCNGEDYREVYFAMLSPTTISLTRVTLASCKSMDNTLAWMQANRSNVNCSKPFAGLACASVEPLALSSAMLTPCKPHVVTLRFLESSVELSAGGSTVSVALEGAQEEPHVWCMQWKSGSIDQQHGRQTSLQLKCIADTDDIADRGAGHRGSPMSVVPSALPFKTTAERLSALYSDHMLGCRPGDSPCFQDNGTAMLDSLNLPSSDMCESLLLKERRNCRSNMLI